MFKYTDKDLERFWAKVEKTAGCWEWKSQTRGGYGMFSLNGKPVTAHRFSLFVEIGEYEGMACHHCDNPSCVRPEHIFAGFQKDNMNDMFTKERRNSRKEYQPVDKRKVRKLSHEDVREIIEALKSPYWGIGNDLARKYGVKHNTISRIRSGEYPAKFVSISSNK